MSVTVSTRRRVGKTALNLPVFGMGAAHIGELYAKVDEADSQATLQAAWDSGVRYYDTAPWYGRGLSEHRLGGFLRTRDRDQFAITTKVGRTLHRPKNPKTFDRAPWAGGLNFEVRFDYSYDGIMRSLDASFQRLGLSRVDILLVHDIGVMTHGAEQNAIYWKQLATGGYRALQELKNADVVKAIGFGVNEWEVLMDAFELGDWDIFLLAGRYTLLEQTSLDPFLSTCIKRGASVIAGAPFNGGALMGTGKWNYAAAPEHIVQRVRDLEAFCAEWKVPIGAAALQFPLTHPAVCNVLTGPRSLEELQGTLNWWNTKIPAEFWTALAEKRLVAPGTPLPNGKVA